MARKWSSRPYRLGDLFQLAAPDIWSNAAKQEVQNGTIEVQRRRLGLGDLRHARLTAEHRKSCSGSWASNHGHQDANDRLAYQTTFPCPLGVTQLDGSLDVEVVDWNSGVYHEDEWLMPIRPLSPDETWQDIQAEMDQYLIDVGAVVPLTI